MCIKKSYGLYKNFINKLFVQLYLCNRTIKLNKNILKFYYLNNIIMIQLIKIFDFNIYPYIIF